MDDDFVEIAKGAVALSNPCTVKCTEVRNPRGGGMRRQVSVSFRTTLLPADVVQVLGQPRFSVAWSAAQGAVRLRGSNAGQYELMRAVKNKDVYVLRFRWQQGMPWHGRRVPLELDYVQHPPSIVLELGAAGAGEPAAPAPRQAPAPVAPRPTPTTADQLGNAAKPPQQPGSPLSPVAAAGEPLAVPNVLGRLRLDNAEADVLTLLSEGGRHTRAFVNARLSLLGHSVGAAGLLSRLRGRLAPLHVDLCQGGDDGDLYWIGPTGQDRLRELAAGRAA